MKIFGANIIFPVETSPIADGYVMTHDDGTVIRYGRISDLSDSERAVMKMCSGAILPGMVNSHCHIELSHLKGAFVKGTGMSGFINQINELRESVGKEGRLKAIDEQMDNLYNQGVSAMADISNCSESFDAKAASPMYTRTFVEVFGTDPAEAAGIVSSAEDLAAQAREKGLDAAPTPHSCYTMSPELLRRASAAGLGHGFISYHSQESPQEEELIRTGTGELADNYKGRNLPTPPVTGGSALSYFIDNLREAVGTPVKDTVLLVHNVVVDQESIDDALANLKSVYWAVCPMSNIFIHNQLPPLDLMMENGLKITVGTDSLSSNDILSMADELETIQEHFPHIAFENLVMWATLNGAEMLGRQDELGSFATGKKPGVVNMPGFDCVSGILKGHKGSVRLI